MDFGQLNGEKFNQFIPMKINEYYNNQGHTLRPGAP